MTFEKLLAAVETLPPSVVYLYTHGGCFEFYRFVSALCPDAEPWYDGHHVIVRIGDRFVDATGEVTPSPCHDVMDPEYRIRARQWSLDLPRGDQIENLPYLWAACERLLYSRPRMRGPDARIISKILTGTY